MRAASIYMVTALLLFSAGTAMAQRFEVPQNYEFNTKEDYHKYDNDIIKCVNWLEKTPVKNDTRKMKNAGDFLLEWLTGCPYVHFTQNVRVDAFLSETPELRVYFMGGWARYALQNPGNTTTLQCNMAGIRCAVKVYKENKSIARNANMDEVASLDEQGKLEEWVKDRLE